MVFAELKESAMDLYNDVDSRPKKVADLLVSWGADKVLSRVGVTEAKAELVVQELSLLTTLSGLKEKKECLSEKVAPYIEKAGCPDGRMELIADTKSGAIDLAAPYIEPYVAAGKEFAAPYISSVKESSAPYVAKLEELRRSERVEAMFAAFKEAREHPSEKVGELRAKAVDLIAYEHIKSYRDHVMSAEFQADTARLLKVELPAVAASAAKRGADTLNATASALQAELEGYKTKAKMIISQGCEMANEVDRERLETLRASLAASSATLIAELQSELSSGVEHIKLEGFSLSDVIARLKRVGVAVDKLVISPLKSAASSPEASEAEADEVEVSEADCTFEVCKATGEAFNGESSGVESNGEEAMHDALEMEPTEAAVSTNVKDGDAAYMY